GQFEEGERDARVFDAFDHGRSMREIVTTLRLPVELVRKLHEVWVKMGSKAAWSCRAHLTYRLLLAPLSMRASSLLCRLLAVARRSRPDGYRSTTKRATG